MLIAVTKTHLGHVRTDNEDLALWDPTLDVLALADGMGGHRAGEVASRLAIETLQHSLAQSDGRSVPADRLKNGFAAGNLEIFRTSEERSECAGMGTTLVAALVGNGTLTFASVGDSRLYLFRDNDLRQLTRDDSLMEALAEAGGLDPASLERHPMRHLLTNVLGRKLDVDMSVNELGLADGDVLLLSSDGMHGAVAPAAIRNVLADEPDLERAAVRLMEAALTADGKDNITLVLARYTAG
jgi:serine/threonine protein phosphatase PrpC